MISKNIIRNKKNTKLMQKQQVVQNRYVPVNGWGLF